MIFYGGLFVARKGVKEVNATADLMHDLLEKTLDISSTGKVILKLVSRTVTGQQDTKTQRIRIGTLRFEGMWRF